MGDTAISWTDKTWNPLTGCTRVSAGCDHCYAFQLHDTRHVAWKRGRMPGAAPQYHQPFSTVQLLPERLTQPLHWRKPARVFVNSMSDLFHEQVPDEFIDQVWAVMALTPRHTYQILTKRPERMLRYLSRPGLYAGVLEASRAWRIARPKLVHIAISDPARFPLPNVWLGTSIEDQDAANARIPWLLRTPAAVRFLSCEPMLGPLDLTTRPCIHGCDGEQIYEGGIRKPRYCGQEGCTVERPGRMDTLLIHDIDWLIAGGESGPHARPLHPDWVRSLRDQCVEAGVKFHFKQWGEWAPPRWAILDKHLPFDPYLFMNIEGKRRAGRELDGRTWDEYPDAMKS